VSEADGDDNPRHRPIRSYVLRQGRITDAQVAAFDRLWPRYGIDFTGAGLDPLALFQRRAPLVFEIGFGAGDALLARAAAAPDQDFIGCEVHRPGVGRVMLRAESAGLSNLRLVCHDAVEVLQQGLAAGMLAEAIVEFPDPWHKKRHHKRRLIQPLLVALLASRLQAGGILRLATDWQNYAEQMLEVCSAEPQLANLATDGGYVDRPDSRPVTRFEARGARLGHGVWDLAFVRRSAPG